MDKRELSNLVRAAGRMLLALGFVFSQTAWAAQGQSQKENSAPAAKATAQQSPVKALPSASAKTESEESETNVKQNAAEETASRDGRHEGIKVHGHWTIEVRNSDGTVVTHREFENSLMSGGATTLASFLTGSQTFAYWSLDLSGAPQPCFETLTSRGGLCPQTAT